MTKKPCFINDKENRRQRRTNRLPQRQPDNAGKRKAGACKNAKHSRADNADARCRAAKAGHRLNKRDENSRKTPKKTHRRHSQIENAGKTANLLIKTK